MARPFRQGDSVISARCLVSEPAFGGVRVEIPVASRGTVTEFDPDGGDRPYVVAFEVGSGGFIEFNVSAMEIGRVTSHGPVVPLIPDGVLAAAYAAPRRLVYKPTHGHPHRLCKPLHVMINLEGFAAYGLVLDMQPFMLLTFTGVFLAAVYLHQLWRYREFTLVPLVLQGIAPCEDEELVVEPERAWHAAVVDLVTFLLLGSLLVHFTVYRVSGEWPDVPLFVAHIVAAGLMCLIKTVAHDRAAHIYPKTAD
jgi:hypothetical protein